MREACRVRTSEFDVTVQLAYLGLQHMVRHSTDCLIASTNNRTVDHRTTILSVGLISELVCMLGSNDPAVRNVGLTHLPNIADNGWFILLLVPETQTDTFLHRYRHPSNDTSNGCYIGALQDVGQL